MSLVSTLVTQLITPTTKPVLRGPNKSDTPKEGPDQVCNKCGETKPRRAFATGMTGKPAKTCHACYREPKKRTGPQVVRDQADARYALLLTGKELSTTEIAAAFGNSHCGTLSSLLRLEERGKVKRVGERPRAPGVLRGRGATVWTWVTNT